MRLRSKAASICRRSMFKSQDGSGAETTERCAHGSPLQQYSRFESVCAGGLIALRCAGPQANGRRCRSHTARAQVCPAGPQMLLKLAAALRFCYDFASDTGWQLSDNVHCCCQGSQRFCCMQPLTDQPGQGAQRVCAPVETAKCPVEPLSVYLRSIQRAHDRDLLCI